MALLLFRSQSPLYYQETLFQNESNLAKIRSLKNELQREKVTREVRKVPERKRKNGQAKILHNKHTFTIIASNFVREQLISTCITCYRTGYIGSRTCS